MKEFTMYDSKTGHITGHYAGSRAPSPGSSIEGHYDARAFLIQNGEAKAVPVWTPEVSANCVAGIPQGSHVRWGAGDHEKAVVDDGTIEFDLVAGQMRLVEITAPGLPTYQLEVYP